MPSPPGSKRYGKAIFRRRHIVRAAASILIALAVPGPSRADPTATRTNARALPLSDSEAASRVIRTGRENRPDNKNANLVMPTLEQLKQLRIPDFIDPRGRATFGAVTGAFTGTTDEILQWGAQKWGFDPDLVRANAVDESDWHQNMVGDIDNGVSLGILQIKSKYFIGTCPVAPAFPPSVEARDVGSVQRYLAGESSCLSFHSTAFTVDYRLAHLRACMNKSIRYLFNHAPAAGHPRYADAQDAELLWGCLGSWYSGYFWDPDGIAYVERVRGFLDRKPWLAASF